MFDRAAETGLERPDGSGLPTDGLGPLGEDEREDRSSIYFLGIFLLLLAFFILLGAIARLDAVKTRGVMSSVAATFRTDMDPKDFSELFVSQLGGIPEPAVLLEGLEGLWLTAVPVARVEVLQPGRTLELSLPLRELFVGRTAAMRSDREDLLSHTVAALAVPFPDQVLQLVAIAGPETRPRNGEGALAFDRAMALAEALEAKQAPLAAFSVGLDPADAGRVRLRFAFREQARAAVEFGKSAPGEVR